MDQNFPLSKVNFTSYKNKKGSTKYQLVMDEEILQKILNHDQDIIAFLKAKLIA